MPWTSRESQRISIVEGNIVLLDVEAVVNAANRRLQLGGGVAGAIRTHGGPSIQEECDRIGPIETGKATLTGGGSLKARYVIHAVGPVWGEGDEERKLRDAVLSSLRIARDNKMKSVAFPAISAGTFGFPLRRCSEIMIETVLGFLGENESPSEVVFCLFGPEALSVFWETYRRLAPGLT